MGSSRRKPLSTWYSVGQEIHVRQNILTLHWSTFSQSFLPPVGLRYTLTTPCVGTHIFSISYRGCLEKSGGWYAIANVYKLSFSAPMFHSAEGEKNRFVYGFLFSCASLCKNRPIKLKHRRNLLFLAMLKRKIRPISSAQKGESPVI